MKGLYSKPSRSQMPSTCMGRTMPSRRMKALYLRKWEPPLDSIRANARINWANESSGTNLGTRGIKWETFAFRRDARCNSYLGANMWYPTSLVWPGPTRCMIFAGPSSSGSAPA